MKLVVTIYEKTPAAAIETIRSLGADHDMIELRVDPFRGAPFDLREVRAATEKPLIVTNRGGAPLRHEAANFVDVEWHPGMEIADSERVVLSHHDFEETPAMEGIEHAMRPHRCAHTKIAVTPRNFADNVRVLEAIKPATTLIGMGSRGLYSRILAPFFGSALQFVSVDEKRGAAPGQLTLERALAIYGERREHLRAETIFAVVGNPAAHSGSPAIHNRLFREAGVAAAYSIFDTDDFLDIAEPFARGDHFAPAGLSVTAPFKEETLAFAQRIGADVRPNAAESGAVNTLVRIGRRIVADNTDVDGFAALIARTPARTAAVVGAGGTARAAIVALRRAGIAARVFNRTAGKLGAEPLDALPSWRGDLLINTLPAGVDVAPPPSAAQITAAYSSASNPLLEAQAIRQNALFLEACR